MFPKICFTIAIYFYHDDRLDIILTVFALTSVTNYLNGITAEELLFDCYNEEVVEFSLIDYYVLIYLDVGYISKKAW